MDNRRKSILDEQISCDYITMTRFVLNLQRRHPTATGELSQLLTNLQSAIKACSSAVRRAGFSDLYGLAGGSNTTGDVQKKLDVIANQLLINMLKSSFAVCAMVSEEDEHPIIVDKKFKGNYIIAFDPLDGSSNIDCLGTIGTIFSIWKHDKSREIDLIKDELVLGRKIVCAGFALYGSATVIVLALSGMVNCFLLDPSIGDFILTQRNMKIPKYGSYFSVNEGHSKYYNKSVLEYIRRKKYPLGELSKPYSARYQGSMVADIYRTLQYGGIFMYPSVKNDLSGKIRLLYEAYPMAYIIEAAGGLASNGITPILDIKPKGIHDTCQIFMGSACDVQELLALYSS